jgi:hypothetical protein
MIADDHTFYAASRIQAEVNRGNGSMPIIALHIIVSVVSHSGI